MVISKSLLSLKEFDTEELFVQSVKYKFPLFETFTCANYFEIVKKEVELYSVLMDVLQGSIPFASFLALPEMSFEDTITSKNIVSLALFRLTIAAKCRSRCPSRW